MLKSSRCTVTFPNNGLSLSSDITFQPGITAVVGRNGTGKTFKTIELWRYLLFGKKALRGPATDYKRLDAQGIVAIQGVDYEIKRTPKGESVTVVGQKEPIAVGADAVNKKVVEVLGFGLEVFDITNASVQKQSSRLTQLTPAKRKELIDEVLGLAKNERVEKDCKDKAKLLRLEADTIQNNAVEPVEPVKPTGYEASQLLGDRLKVARDVAQRRGLLNQILDQTYTMPIAPEVERLETSALEEHESERLRVGIKRIGLEAILSKLPTTTYTKEQVEAARAWTEYDAEVARRGPQPEISRGLAETELALHNRIETLREITDEVECPKCHEVFCPATTITTAVPAYDRRFVEEQADANQAWAEPLDEPSGERIPEDELRRAETALDVADARQKALDQLLELPELDDLSAYLAEARDANAAWDLHDARMEAAAEAEARFNAAAAEMATLPAAENIPELDAAFVSARLYEQAADRFETDLTAYRDLMLKYSALREEADDFTKGAQRLAEARREGKAYLAPSLSRIASSLISEMTCGKLNSVAVDDDMNVTVDGQAAETLSGAGETAANLALRLALGRTLVAGVFPVFLGDEIDADADEERSEATFECLRNLRNQFAQVIIITHKPHVIADHVIDFDE